MLKMCLNCGSPFETESENEACPQCGESQIQQQRPEAFMRFTEPIEVVNSGDIIGDLSRQVRNRRGFENDVSKKVEKLVKDQEEFLQFLKKYQDPTELLQKSMVQIIIISLFTFALGFLIGSLMVINGV